jgi:effector-binding domain-containing protein
MIDTPRILQTADQSTAIVRITVPRSEIRSVMGPGRAELMAVLARQGVIPTGPWFTHHLKMDSKIFDFEIGVPVLGPVAAEGRVTTGRLPAATVARTIYHGPYEGLSSAWQQFEDWIAGQGRKSDPSLWETYLTDPAADPDPATWCTELTRPLAD